MVSVLATEPKIQGLNPGEDERYLTTIQINSMTSLGGKVKPSVQCRKFCTAC
jgi:hypothetical protein